MWAYFGKIPYKLKVYFEHIFTNRVWVRIPMCEQILAKFLTQLINYRNAFKETLCGKKQETTTFGTLANGGVARSTAAASTYDNGHLQVRNGNSGNSSRPPSRLLATPTNTAAIQLNGSNCNLLNVGNLRHHPRKGSAASTADIEPIR